MVKCLSIWNEFQLLFSHFNLPYISPSIRTYHLTKIISLFLFAIEIVHVEIRIYSQTKFFFQQNPVYQITNNCPAVKFISSCVYAGQKAFWPGEDNRVSPPLALYGRSVTRCNCVWSRHTAWRIAGGCIVTMLRCIAAGQPTIIMS